MAGNWIKLHRKILNNFCSTDPEAFTLWIHLLLDACHSQQSFMFNGSKIELTAGQTLTGRKVLAKKTGISESKIFRLLKMLESEQQIEQQKTNKYTIITITNWSKYQASEQQTEQQMNNRRTTDEQQVNTYKNVKNDNNVKNVKKEEPAQSAKPTARVKRPELDDFINMLPDALQSTISRQSIAEWLQYRKDELGKPYKTLTAFKKIITEFKTPMELKQAIDESIKNNWQGLFKPKKQADRQPYRNEKERGLDILKKYFDEPEPEYENIIEVNFKQEN